MYIRLLASIFPALLVLHSNPVAADVLPEEPSQIYYSDACEKWLAPRWAQNVMMLDQLVGGSGDLKILSHDEIRSQIGMPPAVSPSYHRSAFVLLSKTHTHLFNTPATTYTDNPTRYLSFDANQEWLATNYLAASDQLPQHLVILAHTADDSIVRHEMTHLDDFNAIHDYALERLGPGSRKILLVRLSVFLIITELRAYGGEFRRLAPGAYAEDLIAVTSFTLEGLVAECKKNLSAYDWATLLENLGVRDLSRAGIDEFFRSAKPFPEWKAALKGLGPNVVKEMD